MDRLISFFRSKPVFFLFLPVFFVLHGFTENFLAISFGDVFPLWLIYMTASMIIFFIGWLFYRNWSKAALLSFCVMAFDFFFGSIHDLLKKIFDDSLITRYIFLLPFFLLAFILLLVFLKKRKTPMSRISFYLNL